MASILKVGNEEVDLDPNNLFFNETNLSQYLQKEGGLYNNFGAHLANAEFLLQKAELNYDVIYADKFKEYKDLGGSDKLSEARTEADTGVITAKKHVLDAKLVVRVLQQHLRAWDKNHENAQSLGHTLRKEMDKLNNDIMYPGSSSFEEQLENFKKP